MTLRSGNRGSHAGAHRAPRSGATARNPRAGKTGDGTSKAGVIGVRLRSRKTLVRVSAVVVLGALVGIGLARPGIASAEPTVTSFLLDWESGHYLEASELTTGPRTDAARELAAAYQDVGASNLLLSIGTVNQQGRMASATFHASFDLGTIGETWTYTGSMNLSYGSSGWRVDWSPSVINPEMSGDERLAVWSKVPPRASLLDSSGQPLAVPSLAYQVGVYPDQLTDPASTAGDLARATDIPVAQIEGQISASIQASFLTLMTLSPANYDQLRGALRGIPGVIVRPRQESLFDSLAPDVVGTVGTETASILRQAGLPYEPGTTVGLSGLQQTFQRQLTGTPRIEVVLLDKAGLSQDILASWQQRQGEPVETTLDSTVQRAADKALASLPESAAIVAVQPGTGKILAVASRTAGNMPSISPLAGRYEPGQAFTIISSAAILAAGKAPDDPVPCLASNLVDGKSFVNDPPEAILGDTASFEQDFAYACSTAFAGLSESLTGTQLSQAAARFGIGGWELPVSDFFAGQLGQVSSGNLAADAIGTGGVRVSPLGMALAAGVVESGQWHAPSVVAGKTDSSTVPRGAESDQVLAALRMLMRSAASTGANKVADVGGDVYAQVGNAPFAQGRNMHIAWYVGYQGDVAFAVVELGNSASASAASLAGSFLQNIRTGS
jgi:cell division protein FtsI/penicillin-binding protein 2